MCDFGQRRLRLLWKILLLRLRSLMLPLLLVTGKKSLAKVSCIFFLINLQKAFLQKGTQAQTPFLLRFFEAADESKRAFPYL